MLNRIALKTAVALVCLVVTATPARADWLFTPYLGVSFGGDTSGQHVTYGASIGWMGAGIVGWEADFQFTPEFFEPNDTDVDFFGSSNVFTVMGNVIIGIPVGGQTGGGIRPFGIAGIGLIQQNTDSDEAFDIDSNEFGFNLGGGVMGFFNDNVGLRGDIRYVRSFEEADDNLVTIGIGDFDFWRANVGVVFRW